MLVYDGDYRFHFEIKPVMHVNDEGKLIVISKAMGRKKALNTVVENFFQSADMDANDPIFISHADCIEDVEYVKSQILARLPKAEMYVNYIGAVIGSHAGVGTIAIFNKGKNR